MESIVVVKKAALDYFRKKARDSQFEIHAYILGEYVHPDKFLISSIEHAREYEIQTKDCVQPTGEEFSRVKSLAEKQGKRIIGDLHSHPQWDAVMSPQDHKAALEDGLQICGIVSTMKRRTRVRFWLVNSALPCEIKYV
jgi:proteasome lid subunit RPN8/RPN11